jgi:hypothetical protein
MGSGDRGVVPGVPAGWPHLESSQQVLEPFLACASPARFVAMQRGVDMARLVEGLEDWDAVRLGALGPLVQAEASEVLTRKRAAFLVRAAEQYGLPRAEVFALFILHSAFDDELRQLLRLLGEDKQLGETLGRMGAVREELRRRGLKLSEYPDRAERAGDVLRGLGRAGRDVLSSTQVSDGARYQDFTVKRGHLPPPYQAALDEVERGLMEQHFSSGSVALGSFDHLTFGVPLGFYHLVAGTGQGVASLARGRYEQATRELAPAALLVGLYAGGKGARSLSEAGRGVRRLQVPVLDPRGLKEVVGRLESRLGSGAMRDLVRYLRASREAGLLVAEGGELATAALYEARGQVPRARQAWLAEARSPRAQPTATTGGTGKQGGGTAALAREAGGVPLEVLRARLLQAELEATGARLPRDVRLLKEQAPSLEAPPPGVEGHPLWGEYVTYRARRLVELEQGVAAEGPLRWEGYQQMRRLFGRGLAFERLMVSELRADAALPRAQRRWLRDFEQPRIETHVGVAKADVRYVDVLVIEERPPAGQPPRVETFSFKSRDFTPLKEDAMTAQMVADAREALRYYGETLKIRRPGMEMKAKVQRVRLIYEGGQLKPKKVELLESVLNSVKEEIEGVEVSIQ